jgi:hypothetical protein
MPTLTTQVRRSPSLSKCYLWSTCALIQPASTSSRCRRRTQSRALPSGLSFASVSPSSSSCSGSGPNGSNLASGICLGTRLSSSLRQQSSVPSYGSLSSTLALTSGFSRTTSSTQTISWTHSGPCFKSTSATTCSTSVC